MESKPLIINGNDLYVRMHEHVGDEGTEVRGVKRDPSQWWVVHWPEDPPELTFNNRIELDGPFPTFEDAREDSPYASVYEPRQSSPDLPE